jgi:hypothetical protein
MRVATIEREYTAKLDDLRHNYALRVTVEGCRGWSSSPRCTAMRC